MNQEPAPAKGVAADASRPTLRRRLRGFWLNWVKPVVVVVVVLSTLRSAVADWNSVPTGSMKPTILEGERIFVNKMAYDLRVPFTTWNLVELGKPQRGEVVVFFSPRDGTRLVKRVVGLPGDVIAARDNRLFINGKPIAYDTIDRPPFDFCGLDHDATRTLWSERLDNHVHPVMETPARGAMRSFNALQVPDGSYYVLGDNRDESADSRYFGAVPRDRIVGRALAVVTSLDPEHWYRPRWGRFFTALP